MRKAVIDMGTNSTRLAIGEQGNGTVQIVYTQVAETRLGEGVDSVLLGGNAILIDSIFLHGFAIAVKRGIFKRKGFIIVFHSICSRESLIRACVSHSPMFPLESRLYHSLFVSSWFSFRSVFYFINTIYIVFDFIDITFQTTNHLRITTSGFHCFGCTCNLLP